ncbi:hypothetical protein KIH39_04945 [Telmatocola sphagniphila]|uniref:Uncharacterized protein n=1 Tax=Telmatocola sphagniphila TaxID=1123043 RepID=A0A8E6B7E2_9BACT|nr:hypothetical protein [Telmatocola sphagniphila]QVL33267.1 hypothetical protein KIH39_04945 [Telmatocola sphagniphila]
MALFNWGRRNGAEKLSGGTDNPHGYDLTGSRLLVGRIKGEKLETPFLEEQNPSLPLALGLGNRRITFGRNALKTCKKNPHLMCLNLLAELGQKIEWRSDWHRLNPEAALSVWVIDFKQRLQGNRPGLWALPSYLSEASTRMLQSVFAKNQIEVNPFYLPELALVADRVHTLFQTDLPSDEPETGSWHPSKQTKRKTTENAVVLILQADYHALTASLVRVDHNEAKLIASIHLTKYSERFWIERLINGLSDRCVRICRRDPRDSADSEQMLYDQIEPMLEGVRFGRKVTVTVRAETWYQDLILGEEDLTLLAKPLSNPCVSTLVDWLQRTLPEEMPSEVWLRAEAGRLPGLAVGLHQNLAEQTRVRILPADAVAGALVRLASQAPPPGPTDRIREKIPLIGSAS